jgi:hypothetical protein
MNVGEVHSNVFFVSSVEFCDAKHTKIQ